MGLRRLERKRNKPGEPTGLILQLPKLAQVISPMSKRFDVSVKHRAGTATTHRMPGAMNIKPFGSCFLAAADLVSDDRIKNLRATACDRTKSGFAKNFQRVANRHLKNSLGQMTDFDGSKCFYVQLRIERPESFQQIEVPLLFQRWMQSADHVHLGDAQGQRICYGLHDFINCVLEGVASRFLAANAQNWQDKMQTFE